MLIDYFYWLLVGTFVATNYDTFVIEDLIVPGFLFFMHFGCMFLAMDRHHLLFFIWPFCQIQD